MGQPEDKPGREWTPPNAEFPPPKAGEPPLHRAARVGDHDAIRAIVKDGAKLDGVFDLALDPGACKDPATALMAAAGSGDGASVETVKLLLELGADPKQVVEGRSAAMFALSGLGWNYRPGGDAARLKMLLDAGSPLIFEGREGKRLVADCAGLGDPERLKLVLAHGGSPNAVWDAEEAKREAKAEAVLERERMRRYYEQQAKENPDLAGLNVDLVRTSDELTDQMAEESAAGPYSFAIPLHTAAEGGSAECIRVLVKAGANVNATDNSQTTALFSARNREAVEALVEAGVAKDARSRYGKDALDEALDGDFAEEPWRVEVADALLDAGFPLIVDGDRKGSRLYDAAFRENAAAVEYLLAKGHRADPGDRQDSALHAVAWHWDHGDERDEAQRRIVRALVKAGLSVNARNEVGRTPIFDAVAGDGVNLNLTKELVSLGAEVNAQDDDGLTPLAYLYDTAFEYGKVVPILLELGANPLIKDKKGRTALDRAEAMARGEEPEWREELKGDSPPDHPMQGVGWKKAAVEGDEEWTTLQLMRRAAEKFRQ